ncbi:MAG: GtrA family protein [Bacilli bacterium]
MMNFIHKMFKTFFSKAFIVFCIVGVLNTLVHLGAYNAVLAIPGFPQGVLVVIGNTLAFILASLFSYWANATFTYRQKVGKVSFALSVATFIARLVLSDILIWIFNWIIVKEGWDFLLPWAPIPATMILIPLQFLVFNRIFKANATPLNTTPNTQK